MNTPSTKPYMLRALYQWCVDYGFTPYLSVKVDSDTRVPLEHVKEGVIVLNVGPNATRHFVMGNEEVSFHTRFNGVSREVSVPIRQITGIFARENGEGLGFPVEDQGLVEPKDSPEVLSDELDQPEASEGQDPEAPSKGRHLRVIK